MPIKNRGLVRAGVTLTHRKRDGTIVYCRVGRASSGGLIYEVLGVGRFESISAAARAAADSTLRLKSGKNGWHYWSIEPSE